MKKSKKIVKKNKRPVIITVLCIIGFLGALLVPFIALSDAARLIGSWYPPYLAVSGVIGLACFIGLWMMRKWGIMLYTLLFIIDNIVFISKGIWSIVALLIPLVVIAIGFAYYKRMK